MINFKPVSLFGDCVSHLIFIIKCYLPLFHHMVLFCTKPHSPSDVCAISIVLFFPFRLHSFSVYKIDKIDSQHQITALFIKSSEIAYERTNERAVYAFI